MENYVNKIKPYGVSSYNIWELDERERKYYLKLDWNEATIPPSPKVKKRLQELVLKEDFYQWYPDTNNNRLISKLSKYVGVGVENIQIFPSSDTLQEYVIRCWLKERDKALIMWPTYDNFRVSVEAAKADVTYSLYSNFKFDINSFEEDVKRHAPRLIYICNPNNPTGGQIDIDVLEKMLKNNENVMFLLDEAYVEFSGQSVVKLTSKYENLLVSRTFSKAFALANFRIGYLVSSKKNIDAITKIRNSKNIPTFSQEVAIAALDDLEYMKKYVENVKNARESFADEMRKYSDVMSVYPSKANFIMIKMNTQEMKRKFLEFMKRNRIYIRDLQQNILSDCYVRITVGTKLQMDEVAKKVKEFKETL